MDGTALILCEGAFGTSYGKTAHGLVRHTERYHVLGVIDSTLANRDAGEVLDGKRRGIPIFTSLSEALERVSEKVNYLVIGVATDGGVLPDSFRPIIIEAIKQGLNIDNGLHQFLSEDAELEQLAKSYHVRIRDVRRPPDRSQLHFFSDKIREVSAVKIAVLGTDSAVGKRTTAIMLTQALRSHGLRAEMVGTGQTSWMQGFKYTLILDSLVNDFVSGEIEHAVYEAFVNERPDVIIIEGQGSITNPAYPGGFEIIAAARPDGIILQHAPHRKTYDGFPDYPMGSLDREIQIIELLSQKPLLALTINHEDMTDDEIRQVKDEYEKNYQIPTCDVLKEGCDRLLRQLGKRFPQLQDRLSA